MESLPDELGAMIPNNVGSLPEEPSTTIPNVMESHPEQPRTVNPHALESLPKELGVMILNECDDSLVPLIQASKYMRDIFNKNKVSSQRQLKRILSSKISKAVFPLAWALCHVTATTWAPTQNASADHSPYNDKVALYCGKYLKPPCNIATITDPIEIGMLVQMISFYELVDEMVPEVALMIGLSPDQVRPDERDRFARCIYIHELARIMVPYILSNGVHPDLTAWIKFWSCFSPWEAAGIHVFEEVLRDNASYPAWETLDEYSYPRHGNVANQWITTTHEDHRHNTHPFCILNLHDLELGAGDIAVRLGVRALRLLDGQNVLPVEFFQSSWQLCRAGTPAAYPLRTSLFDDVSKYCCEIWYPSGRRVEDVMSIVERYQEDPDDAPMRLWLLSQIYHNLQANSPLEIWTRCFEGMFHERSRNDNHYNYFGFPYMAQFSFLDVEHLKRPHATRLPTLDLMMLEAEAMADDDLEYQDLDHRRMHARFGQMFLLHFRLAYL